MAEPRAGKCRSCKAPVVWHQHPESGRWMIRNPDGTDHHATCPQAKDWGQLCPTCAGKKFVAIGQECPTCGGSGRRVKLRPTASA